MGKDINKDDGRDRTSLKHLQQIDPRARTGGVMAGAAVQERRATKRINEAMAKGANW